MRLALIFALAWSLAPHPTAAFAQGAPERAPVAAPASASPGVACSRDLLGQDDPEPSTDYERRASSTDPCAVADANLAREEAEILKAKPPAAAAPRVAWDRKSSPQFLKNIVGRFDLVAIIGHGTPVTFPARRSSRRWHGRSHERRRVTR